MGLNGTQLVLLKAPKKMKKGKKKEEEEEEGEKDIAVEFF